MNRELGLEILSTVINIEKNRQILEKHIYNAIEEENKENNETYLWYIYQVVGLIINKEHTMKDILEIIKNKQLGWNQPCYKEISEKIHEHDEYLIKPFDIVEGVTTCVNCGSKKTWNIQKQVRSQDEPMTTFSRCSDCGKQWSYSG